MSVETTASRFDSVKWVVVAALVAVAVVGNSYFSDQSLLYRVLGIVALAVVAGLVDRNPQGSLAYSSGNRPNHHDSGGICNTGGTATVGTGFLAGLAGVAGNWIRDRGKG